MGRHQSYLEHKLLLVALRGLRKGRQEFETSGQVCDRLRVRRALDRALGGAPVALDGLFGKARFGKVMGEQLGLGRYNLGELCFERRGDPGMKVLAPAAQQAVIGCVPDQRVLELEGGARRRAPAEDEAGIGQPIQRVSQFGVAPLRDRR